MTRYNVELPNGRTIVFPDAGRAVRAAIRQDGRVVPVSPSADCSPYLSRPVRTPQQVIAARA